MTIDRKTQKRVDEWEAKTSVWVAFDLENQTVHLEGEFTDKELSEIASIQRKSIKSKKPKPTKQPRLIPDTDIN
jgi:hypothetical protein